MIEFAPLTHESAAPVGKMTSETLEWERQVLSLSIAEDVVNGHRVPGRDKRRFQMVNNELRSRQERIERLDGESYGDYVKRCLQ